MEALEQSIEAYELQVKQVKDAIVASATGTEDNTSQKNDLVQLQNDLEHLITLTKQNLLELKKEQLLKEIESHTDSCEDINIGKDGRTAFESSSSRCTFEKNEEATLDLSSLEGVRCQAPFKSINSANECYHNAIVFSVNDNSKEQPSFEDLHVRVVFSNPTSQKMLPCEFYLEGRCKFAGDQCRYSHGELVALSKLKEFCEPDYATLREGILILAKEQSSKLWKHAVVEGVEEIEKIGTAVHLRYSHDKKEIVTLALENVLPLNDSSDGENESDDDYDKLLGIDQNNDIPIVHKLLDGTGGSASCLGGWECHTRGIGSKLMASMGYVHGTGLGKVSEGRVEPVPIMIYPSGCSLDWCMDVKEKTGGSKANQISVFSAEKVLERLKKKEERRNLLKLEKEKSRERRERSLFDLINTKLTIRKDPDGSEMAFIKGHRKGSTLSKNNSTGTSSFSRQNSDGKSQKKSLKLEGIKTYEEIRRTGKEIEKLQQSLNRHKSSNDKVIVSRKLQQQKNYLKNLKSRENSINEEQARETNRKKLEIF